MNEISETGSLTLPAGRILWLLHANESEAATELLSEAEAADWAALKSDKRRQDWLLGRYAAKRLVAGMLQEQGWGDIPLTGIIIRSYPDGWPMVSLLIPGSEAPPITLSLSHSHDWAFAAAVAGRELPLGADLELVEQRSAAFVADYFTPAEQSFLAAAPPEQFDVLANAIWSGKEAALKAIRRGLAEDTRLITCLPHPIVGDSVGWLPIRYTWHSDTTRELPDLRGFWRLKEKFVMTLAFEDRAH